jgi:predicted enzyme related to lactoylglutathione lyase
MEMTKHSLSWFEIPVQDFDRARSFYQTILDYEMPEMNMDDSRMGILPHDREGGGVGGAIIQNDVLKPSSSGTMVYLDGGKDLAVILDRIPGAGGRVLVKKTLITPEMGFYAVFQDSEGNCVGLFSPK